MVHRLILLSISILFLHFFEEFGWPGGFPWLGVHLLLKSNDRDISKWNCNNLNCMFGNWGFLLMVYAMPIAFPKLTFLALGVMIFNFVELFVHLVAFPIRQKKLYDAGLITAFFGLAPVSIYYFTMVYSKADFTWMDYGLVVVWFAICFWFFFRSPLY